MNELDPRIRIRAPLRCDGIGRLDCAEDTISGDRLAVRWLPLDANGDAAVKACEKLPAHPTLPRILQTGQVGASAFVALDFPAGETLCARGEERLENSLLLKLGAQLSDALATLHEQGVVHGEMSRDSVLVDPSGKAILWDVPLVIANRLSDRRGESRLMQNLVKTAPFLAPERARGAGASQEADVYALGTILCVCAGAPLPTAATTLGVIDLVAHGTWVPRVPSSLPERWTTMLTRMVCAEASQRPLAREVAIAFSMVPGQGVLPTVPDMPSVRLPPEIQAAADSLMKSQVEAMRAPTRELPVAPVEEVVANLVSELPPPPPPEEDTASPDVLQVESKDIVSGDAEPQPSIPQVSSAPWVAITDSLSIAPQLLIDGAKRLSEPEFAAIRSRFPLRWAVVVGLGLLALTLVGFLGAPSGNAIAEESPLMPVPAAHPQHLEPLDELTPLQNLPPKSAAKIAPRPTRAGRQETNPLRDHEPKAATSDVIVRDTAEPVRNKRSSPEF